MLKNSIQMWNLVKILNKDKCMEGLNSINDVYDSQVNAIEEILYYHMYRDRFNDKDAQHSQLQLAASINSSRNSEVNEDEGPQLGGSRNKYAAGRLTDNSPSFI
jgi:hypothetical protein